MKRDVMGRSCAISWDHWAPGGRGIRRVTRAGSDIWFGCRSPAASLLTIATRHLSACVYLQIASFLSQKIRFMRSEYLQTTRIRPHIYLNYSYNVLIASLQRNECPYVDKKLRLRITLQSVTTENRTNLQVCLYKLYTLH